MLESLHEVRVTDERASKGNQVSVAFCDSRLRRFLGVAAITDGWAFDNLTELAESHWPAKFVEAEGQSVHEPVRP